MAWKFFKFLSPSQRAQRYANQLKNGCVAETGVILDETDKKYRQGYLDARRHNAEAWCAKNNVPSKSRERRKAYYQAKKAQKAQTNAKPKSRKKKIIMASDIQDAIIKAHNKPVSLSRKDKKLMEHYDGLN